MNSIAEQQRQAYEDIERIEQAIVDMMLQDLTKHRYKLIREQKISALLEQIQSRSKFLQEIEQDESGLRRKESAGMADNKFDEFYSRLGDIREYHQRNPDISVHPPEVEYIKYKNNPEESEERERVLLAKAEEEDGGDVPEIPDVQTFIGAEDEHRLDTMFSGEERLGRYVDLHEQHELYVNLKDSGHPTYLDYLADLHRVEAYPKRHKLLPEYAQYLDSLREYFDGYFLRAMPLFDVPKARDEAIAQFDTEWAERKVLGWTADEDTAKVRALYCAACDKQFEKSTTLAAHMGSRKHQKAVARQEDSSSDAKRSESERKVALDECIVRLYVQILGTKIRETRANVQRRQALTEEERDQEIDEEEHVYVEDKDDRDEQIYNPLNLPLGWDGKPIPYWLYKLHGLGVKFSCEICGNSVYRGRKAYEKHFQEARHATNMRRLGIPNTRQFHGVAAIDEAQALWERVQMDKKREVANVDTVEEYEDSEGNVFNKKTYFDLKRQGLI
ncbi:Pre-mRNA-splicing factor sap61 [Coemansia aciculifera]|uniref:Pre-mRNA-splicing factor sap61 n=1 Tax=Coemansia aciculifera TaxID=417176 RepID=A0A9W8ICX0_9FUNG|nr:Pre-mRNA-splicing factor sap61 [Coemansia aciculifera]KAJ2870289.1 Pre-mRNA-splicing factor sap61 [Coemansia aciculifera]KAJ2887217.1 Pre-mRNA-splicing factor sap61 [Coemansia aciculifera]